MLINDMYLIYIYNAGATKTLAPGASTLFGLSLPPLWSLALRCWYRCRGDRGMDFFEFAFKGVTVN